MQKKHNYLDILTLDVEKQMKYVGDSANPELRPPRQTDPLWN